MTPLTQDGLKLTLTQIHVILHNGRISSDEVWGRFGSVSALRNNPRIFSAGKLLSSGDRPISAKRRQRRRVGQVMPSTGEVYLGLYGDDFEPNEVSTFIGLAATRIARRGERNAVISRPRESAWKFSLGKVEADVINVYEMSNSLIEQLAPYESKIVEAVRVFGLFAVLQVVLWIDQDETASMPAIGFERPVLDFLTAVSATIDIDSYRN